MAEGQSSNPRQRLRVELRPGETTIVSWKKLLKEATAPKDNAPSAPPTVPSVVDAPVTDANEAQPTSRLSTVIERIERLYVGKASSDEEDLNDVVPDEDEYDTEDSFIDDAELDEYFQVDNSAIKHDGFFVNRGKLERIEPTELSNQQHKKRRRKDLPKDPGGLAVKNPNKHLKVGKKNEKPATFDGNHPTTASHIVALPSVRPEGVKLQDQVTAPEIPVKKKTTEAKNISLVSCTDESNVDGRRQEKVVIQQKQALGPSTNSIGEMSAQRSSHGQGKSPPVRPSKNVDDPEQTTKVLEFSSSHERPAITRPNGNKPVQVAGAHASQRKEGSSVRPRSTMLEKAIRDLEKMVAECRPPVSEVQDGENSSQSVKRRLPPEVKQKIAKVARLAQASHGKISKEVLNRLMSIVGHMIQLRSLKRNLKIMVNMGLSAKQEKDHRVQLIKGEVADMVQARIPLIKSKSQEQLGGMSDDFKESKTEKTAALERNYSMDCTLEDKICDLYDLYVEGLEADAGPHVRKLYAELAAFWPSGLMDNHGIKRAICRAKDRKRPLQSQNLEKVKKKKKALVPKLGGIKSKVEASLPAQSLQTGPSNHGLSENKLISSKTVATSTSQMPGSSVGVSSSEKSKQEKSKQEKMKGTLSGPGDANKTDLITRKPTMTPDLEQSDEIERSHEETENLPKEGMIKRQHLTASMLSQLFET